MVFTKKHSFIGMATVKDLAGIGALSKSLIHMVLGHNPETHNPEYPQPGKTQPGKLQPGRDTT